MTFDEWLEEVDLAVLGVAGVSVHDLADVDFMSAYEDEIPPLEFAEEMLAEEGLDL